MRRLSLLLALVLLAAVAPSAQGKSEVRKLTIEVMSYARVTIPHDLAPKGKENKGDWIHYQDLLVATGPLFGKKAGVPVGWDKGTLTYTSATTARVRGTANFPGQGSLKFKGKLKPLANGGSQVPIIGGGGKFAGAKGLLIIGPGNLKALNTFKFTLHEGTVA